VLGLFRYFNGSPGITFERNQKYFVHSTVNFTITRSVSYTQ
jgi:hypothetical protein